MTQPTPGLLLFFCVCFCACAVNDKPKEAASSIQDTLLKADKIDEGKLLEDRDTLRVTKVAAVFYEPDSVQMEARKKEIGEENFIIGADDYLFYLQTASEYLEKQRVPLVPAQNKKFVQFIGANNQVTLVRLDTLPELWGIFIFDPGKLPKAIDMTNVEEEYKTYYQ